MSSLVQGGDARKTTRQKTIMPKVLLINGSPHNTGCTALALNDMIKVFEEEGVDPDFYTLRERREDEIFPWDFIDIGVSKAFLLHEWHRAGEGKVTGNCRIACNGCGADSFGCGLCHENQSEI